VAASGAYIARITIQLLSGEAWFSAEIGATVIGFGVSDTAL